MEVIVSLVALFPIGIGLLVLSLLIYFIVKRVEDKSKEDFEKRDN
mgnify:CR=1 FL=1